MSRHRIDVIVTADNKIRYIGTIAGVPGVTVGGNTYTEVQSKLHTVEMGHVHRQLKKREAKQANGY